MSQLLDRIPPENIEAERAVLGAAMVDRETMAGVSQLLLPQDFYAPVHQPIFTALLALYNKREPLDKITVCEELARMGKLETVGGDQLSLSMHGHCPICGIRHVLCEYCSREGFASGPYSRWKSNQRTRLFR